MHTRAVWKKLPDGSPRAARKSRGRDLKRKESGDEKDRSGCHGRSPRSGNGGSICFRGIARVRLLPGIREKRGGVGGTEGQQN